MRNPFSLPHTYNYGPTERSHTEAEQQQIHMQSTHTDKIMLILYLANF